MSDAFEIRRGDARYELYVDGELASYVDLLRRDGVVVLPHTYTVPAFRGNGLAERVVHAALDDLLADGASIVPSCWFVADVVRAEPRYRPLVDRV
jgi:predicted GNAT family acetyltransferase